MPQAEFSEHRVHDLTGGNATRRELTHRHCERDSALRHAEADGAASCAVAQNREPAPAAVEAAAQLKAVRVRKKMDTRRVSLNAKP